MSDSSLYYLIQQYDGLVIRYLQPNGKFELSQYTAREFTVHKSALRHLAHLIETSKSPGTLTIIEA